MTAYLNFVKGFPLRCLDILDGYVDWTRIDDREVTLVCRLSQQLSLFLSKD
jgi:hypothetical protein